MVSVPPEVACATEGRVVDETVCLRVVENRSERRVRIKDPGLHLLTEISTAACGAHCIQIAVHRTPALAALKAATLLASFVLNPVITVFSKAWAEAACPSI